MLKHDRSKPALIAGLLCGLIFGLPCQAQTHPRSRSPRDAAIKNVLRQYLKEHNIENASSARYMSALVDLNDDGKEEVVVYVISQDLCGTGGCLTLVLAPQQSSFTIVSKITISRPPIRVLKTKSHGWHDLAVFVAGGGIQPGYEADVPFNGKRYATNPSIPPAHRLNPQSTGRIVIPDSAAFIPLD